jgi:hypothetical protein
MTLLAQSVKRQASDARSKKRGDRVLYVQSERRSVKKYVEVTDEEMDGSSDLRLAPAPLAFTPAQRQCTYFIYV